MPVPPVMAATLRGGGVLSHCPVMIPRGSEKVIMQASSGRVRLVRVQTPLVWPTCRPSWKRRSSSTWRSPALGPGGARSILGSSPNRMSSRSFAGAAAAEEAVRPEEMARYPATAASAAPARAASWVSAFCLPFGVCCVSSLPATDWLKARPGPAQRREGYGALASGVLCRLLGEHEGKDEDNGEDALSRVDDDPHPCALEPPRGIGEGEDVHQGGGDHPRNVQVVDREQHPVGDKVAPSKDAPHSRQQKPTEEQLLAEHGVEDDEHDLYREPAPCPLEEFLATVAAQELAEVPRHGSRDSWQDLLEAEEHQERQHPPPDPSTHAPGSRIAGWPQPQGVAHARPSEAPQLVPGEDQD